MKQKVEIESKKIEIIQNRRQRYWRDLKKMNGRKITKHSGKQQHKTREVEIFVGEEA